MLERLDMQIVRVIDILTDLQDHRHRLFGSEIGPDNLGNLVTALRRYATRMLLPLGMSRGRSGLVRPVFGLGNQDFRILLPELIGPVLLLIFLEFLCGFFNIFRAVQFVDVLLEFSAVNQCAHFLLLEKAATIAAATKSHISENLESAALARSR